MSHQALYSPMKYTITYVSSSARPEEELTLSGAGEIERRSGCLWRSARDSAFPQTITIDLTPDTDGNQLVSRLEIVVHEKMVPREIVILIASTPETQPDGKFVPSNLSGRPYIASNAHGCGKKVDTFNGQHGKHSVGNTACTCFIIMRPGMISTRIFLKEWMGGYVRLPNNEQQQSLGS